MAYSRPKLADFYTLSQTTWKPYLFTVAHSHYDMTYSPVIMCWHPAILLSADNHLPLASHWSSERLSPCCLLLLLRCLLLQIILTRLSLHMGVPPPLAFAPGITPHWGLNHYLIKGFFTFIQTRLQSTIPLPPQLRCPHQERSANGTDLAVTLVIELPCSPHQIPTLDVISDTCN